MVFIYICIYIYIFVYHGWLICHGNMVAQYAENPWDDMGFSNLNSSISMEAFQQTSDAARFGEHSTRARA